MSPRNGYTNLYMTSLSEGEKDLEAVLKGERSAEFESFHAFESGFDVSSDGVVVLGSKFLDRDALMLWDIDFDKGRGRPRFFRAMLDKGVLEVPADPESTLAQTEDAA